MIFEKTTKRILSLSLVVAVTAGSAVAPATEKKTDAATKYKAQLCFMSENCKIKLGSGADRSKGVTMSEKTLSGIKVKDATW